MGIGSVVHPDNLGAYKTITQLAFIGDESTLNEIEEHYYLKIRPWKKKVDTVRDHVELIVKNRNNVLSLDRVITIFNHLYHNTPHVLLLVPDIDDTLDIRGLNVEGMDMLLDKYLKVLHSI